MWHNQTTFVFNLRSRIWPLSELFPETLFTLSFSSCFCALLIRRGRSFFCVTARWLHWVIFMTFLLIPRPSSYGFWVHKICLRFFGLFKLILLYLQSFSLQQQLRSLFIHRVGVEFVGRVTKTHFSKLQFPQNFLFIHTKNSSAERENSIYFHSCIRRKKLLIFLCQ
jgi:hypothetical protein